MAKYDQHAANTFEHLTSILNEAHEGREYMFFEDADSQPGIFFLQTPTAGATENHWTALQNRENGDWLPLEQLAYPVHVFNLG